MLTLVGLSNPILGQRFDVTGSRTTIGRRDCDLTLDIAAGWLCFRAAITRPDPRGIWGVGDTGGW